MQVSNTEWELVGSGGDAELVVQNVGETRIGFVISDALPQSDDDGAAEYVDLSQSGDFGLLWPGADPMTLTTLDDNSLNLYVRSLGPREGSLYVNAVAAP